MNLNEAVEKIKALLATDTATTIEEDIKGKTLEELQKMLEAETVEENKAIIQAAIDELVKAEEDAAAKLAAEEGTADTSEYITKVEFDEFKKELNQILSTIAEVSVNLEKEKAKLTSENEELITKLTKQIEELKKNAKPTEEVDVNLNKDKKPIDTTGLSVQEKIWAKL